MQNQEIEGSARVPRVAAGVPPTAPDNAAIEALEAELLNRPQIPMPLTHHFAPSLYMREIFMPAGTFVIGHQHRTEHFNIVLTGRATVMMNGEVHELAAPTVLKSAPGVRKILYIREDMRWITVHPTYRTDLDELEDELIVKSGSYLKHLEDLEALKAIMNSEFANLNAQLFNP